MYTLLRIVHTILFNHIDRLTKCVYCTCWIQILRTLIYKTKHIPVGNFYLKPHHRTIWLTHFLHTNRLLIDITMGCIFLVSIPLLMTHVSQPMNQTVIGQHPFIRYIHQCIHNFRRLQAVTKMVPYTHVHNWMRYTFFSLQTT